MPYYTMMPYPLTTNVKPKVDKLLNVKNPVIS